MLPVAARAVARVRAVAPIGVIARGLAAAAAKPHIKVTFVKPDGGRVDVRAPVGDSMLEVAHANNIDIEGACGGETACSTCHIILESAVYKRLPSPTDEEEDMLDLAAGLTKTSRLGCQVIATTELDGMVVTLPKDVANMMSKE